MIRILFTTLIFLTFTSFMPPKEKESFEGIITYKITFIPKPGNEEYTKHQSQKFGKSLILSVYKNGNFKREYPFSGMLFGTDFSIYMQQLNRLYTKMRNNDTIKASDCAKNTLIQKEETEKEDAIINGVACKSYFISGGDARSKQPTSLHYFYPVGKEYIDWKLYANFNDMFYNKLVLKMQAPYYKLIMESIKYSVVYELEKIEPKKLTPDVINFPKGKPVKEL
ncbi:MAG: hypothetical protein H0W73_06110 [Bacteroidetes bacterium]|nr:hypothetical protein [Bacteroidota bacterium]